MFIQDIEIIDMLLPTNLRYFGMCVLQVAISFFTAFGPQSVSAIKCILRDVDSPTSRAFQVTCTLIVIVISTPIFAVVVVPLMVIYYFFLVSANQTLIACQR